MSLTCFKAYDIRGKLGSEINDDIAYRIGRAYARFIQPGTVVVGGDVRLTSEALKLAVARGLQDEGVDVIDIGMCGTEEIYIVVAKTTEAKCVLDCIGPRSMRVERIENGDRNDYGQAARGSHARPRIK